MGRGLKLGTGRADRVAYNGDEAVWKVVHNGRVVFYEELKFSGESRVECTLPDALGWPCASGALRWVHAWRFQGVTGTGGSGIRMRWYDQRGDTVGGEPWDDLENGWSAWSGAQYWDRVGRNYSGIHAGGHATDPCQFLKLQGDPCWDSTEPGNWRNGWNLYTATNYDPSDWHGELSKHFRIRYDNNGVPVGFQTWNIDYDYPNGRWYVVGGTTTNTTTVQTPIGTFNGWAWKLQFVPINDYSFGLRFWIKNQWDTDGGATWKSEGTTGTNNCIIVTRGKVQHEHQPWGSTDPDW